LEGRHTRVVAPVMESTDRATRMVLMEDMLLVLFGDVRIVMKIWCSSEPDQVLR
jgi:hypothetical protein